MKFVRATECGFEASDWLAKKRLTIEEPVAGDSLASSVLEPVGTSSSLFLRKYEY
jgi:hypothetical protein